MNRIVLGMCGMALLMFLSGCGKFDDPNIKNQYYVYLEDEETRQPVSDQVLFTMYKNGTATCGFAVLNREDGCPEGISKEAQQCHEDACYKMVETVFNAQLDALLAQLEAEAAAQAEGQAADAQPAESGTPVPAPIAPATP